jgi:holo-[acyl-carrier protein] synthase
VGVGTDLVHVPRLAQALARHTGFATRVYTPTEIAYCEQHREPGPRYAARFAAKEAVSKCFTTGIGAELGWRSISIYHGVRQQPLVRLDEKAQALLRAVGATHVQVSLSHTETVAMAVAVLLAAPSADSRTSDGR